MNKQDYYWYWINNIPGIGRMTIHRPVSYTHLTLPTNSRV